ncbi:MAG: hypothetical protein R3C24_17965 [Cyanobacteriota/Melainabacteria group bacterium]
MSIRAEALLGAHVVRAAEDLSCLGQIMGLSIRELYDAGDAEVDYFNQVFAVGRTL